MSKHAAARHRSDAGNGSPWTGTGRLLRAMLRSSRWSIALWAIVSAGLLYYMAQAVQLVMGDSGLQARAGIIGMPAGAMLSGPGYGLENYTLPVMVANELLGGYAVAVAIMSLRLVVRYTRNDEESGRTELLRALPVGRLAPLSAALITGLVGNLLVAALMFLALLACGFQLAGSLGFALGLLGVGLVFCALGAVTAQLSTSARIASSLGGALLGLTYLLRALGDASTPGGNLLSWLSPIGWIQQQRLYVQQRSWPLLLVLGLVLVLLVVGYRLQDRREVGAGLLAQRPGRARASAASRTVMGLGLRLDRGRILIWAVSIFIGALMTGTLAGPVADAFREIPQLQAVLGVQGSQAQLEDIVVAAMATFLAFFAMVVGIFALQAPHRLRRDEALGRADLLLATPVSRWWLMGSQMLLGFVGSALLLALAGLGLGLGAQGSLQGQVVGTFVAAALWYLPVVACWLMLAMLALGLGRGAVVLWLLLVCSILVGMYGPIMNLPQWLLDAEPFTSVKALDIVRGTQGIGLPAGYAVAALVLAAAALAFYRRRQVNV